MSDPWRYCCPVCHNHHFRYRATTDDYVCRTDECRAVFDEPLDKKDQNVTGVTHVQG